MIKALLALSLFVQPATPAEEYTLPAELCRGYWLLPVTLEPGPSGEKRVLWFLHDTGASTSFLDPDSIERVSGQRLEPGDRARIEEASAGPLTINELSTRVAELDHLSIALGRPIDGIMSVFALEDFLLILDYPAGEMRLQEAALPRPDAVRVFSTRGPDRRPWLNVDLAGRTRPLLIDSGAGGLTIAVNRIDRFDLVQSPEVLTSAVRFNRIEQRRMARLDGEADVAGLAVRYPVLEEVPRSELLGGEILKHFVVTLDQANRRVRFEPVTEGPIEPADHYEIGAGFRPNASGLEVIAVYPDTPAARAGLQRGDQVTAFDGVPIAERGCNPSQPESALAVTVRRGEAELDLSLDLLPVLPFPEP